MRRIAPWLAFTATLSALPNPPAFLLPDDVVPRKHTIELTIDPTQPTFEGRASIEIELSKSTALIWLNAKDITPGETTVEFAGRVRKARAEEAGGEFLGVELDAPIGPGRATVTIRYQGKLDEKSVVGPYRKQVDNEWYVFTTFTPIDARRAFPSFDEPRFKTPWQLSIHIKREHKAFTNTRMLGETDEPGGMKLVRFAPTERLPAEVVAFAVGPFDVYEGKPAGHGTPIRVISSKGHQAEGHAAAEATIAVLPRLEAYTGIPYPFGKLDHVALPEGAFGAVENPGLITYRRQALLHDPADETKENTRPIRRIQSHEIAHQWFGDLVTQATWQDVWLSEGFATWLSAKVMDQEESATRQRLSAVAARERIMLTDESPRARPVRLVMNSRDDMDNRQRGGVYSQMVYQKGAAILLMLEGWLGDDKVRDGLRAYLTAHRLGNATTDDLASALNTSSGVDPSPVMRSFLDTSGVPLVSGSVRCPQGGAPIVHLEATGATAIPVCWRTEGTKQSCTVLDAPRDLAISKATSCPAWIYFNSGATGYYRTAWTSAQLATLALAKLSAAERLTLVFDLAALKKSGQLDPAAILTELAKDREPEIVKAAADALK
jgi:alanyl aminopeptidase